MEKMIGTCHLRKRVDLYQECGFTWARVWPERWFEVGSARADRRAFAGFREGLKPYAEAGIRFIGITPGPKDLTVGEPGSPQWLADFRESCKVAAGELGDLVPAWTIANELNSYYFRHPLQTLEQAAEFVGVCGDGLRQSHPGARLSINMAGFGESAVELWELLHGPHAPIELDWIGADGYFGSWEPGGPEDWKAKLDLLEVLGRGRPIIIHEFGYGGRGRVVQPGEVDLYLRRLGYVGIESVFDDPTTLLAAMTPLIREYHAEWPSDRFRDFLPHLIATHAIKRWPHGWGGDEHTPALQAFYLETAFDILLRDPRVVGVFSYCWSDHAACCICGEPDCPLETAWGLVDVRENPKPAYWAVQRIIRRHAGT